jgi:isoquinoline 1-oxidoreductase beta subunit
VKLIWTREEDIAHDLYRPRYYDRLSAGIDADGKLAGWSHKVGGSSVMARWLPAGMQGELDPDTVEGAVETPYELPAQKVEYVRHETPGVTTAWWRGVGPTHNVFVVESFIDECAAAAHRDPLDYRRSLLGDKEARHRAVLDLLADKSGWNKPLAAGRARGMALHESFGSVVGEVAEVSLENGLPRVHRVVAVIHCGLAVNPQMVAAQLESAVNFGLSAALYGQITRTAGKPDQSNFDTYRVVRMNEAPAVEVYIVPSEEAPTGVGEPGTPPIAPAVANALFALTGKRVRRLPMVREGTFQA